MDGPIPPDDAATSSVRPYRGDYRWESVDLLAYKEEGTAPFRAVTRQVLFHDPRLRAELRYFEVAAGGWSTLERHEHMHGVLILRGRGRCLVGDRVFPVGPNDLVTIAPWTWHQFRADAGEALGFLCMVNTERDRPQLPDAAALAALAANPLIAEFLSGGN
jgi:mannose-6-phosphate isomerase-like protein (cupin superfamily)